MSEAKRTFVVHAPALRPGKPSRVEADDEPPLAYYDSAGDVLFVSRDRRDEVIVFLEEREKEAAVAGDGGAEEHEEDEQHEEGEEGEEETPQWLREWRRRHREWLRRLREWRRRLREGEDRELREWDRTRVPRIGDVRIRDRQCVTVRKEWACVEIESVDPPLYLKAGPEEYEQCVGSRERHCSERYSVVASGELYEDPECTVVYEPAENVEVHDWICVEM